MKNPSPIKFNGFIRKNDISPIHKKLMFRKLKSKVKDRDSFKEPSTSNVDKILKQLNIGAQTTTKFLGKNNQAAIKESKNKKIEGKESPKRAKKETKMVRPVKADPKKTSKFEYRLGKSEPQKVRDYYKRVQESSSLLFRQSGGNIKLINQFERMYNPENDKGRPGVKLRNKVLKLDERFQPSRTTTEYSKSRRNRVLKQRKSRKRRKQQQFEQAILKEKTRLLKQQQKKLGIGLRQEPSVSPSTYHYKYKSDFQTHKAGPGYRNTPKEAHLDRFSLINRYTNSKSRIPQNTDFSMEDEFRHNGGRSLSQTDGFGPAGYPETKFLDERDDLGLRTTDNFYEFEEVYHGTSLPLPVDNGTGREFGASYEFLPWKTRKLKFPRYKPSSLSKTNTGIQQARILSFLPENHDHDSSKRFKKILNLSMQNQQESVQKGPGVYTEGVNYHSLPQSEATMCYQSLKTYQKIRKKYLQKKAKKNFSFIPKLKHIRGGSLPNVRSRKKEFSRVSNSITFYNMKNVRILPKVKQAIEKELEPGIRLNDKTKELELDPIYLYRKFSRLPKEGANYTHSRDIQTTSAENESIQGNGLLQGQLNNEENHLKSRSDFREIGGVSFTNMALTRSDVNNGSIGGKGFAGGVEGKVKCKTTTQIFERDIQKEIDKVLVYEHDSLLGKRIAKVLNNSK